MDTQQVAEAFSTHRFAEVHDRLADDVRWVVPGQPTIVGKDAVVAACEETSEHLRALASATFSRLVSVGSPTVAAVDAIGRYESEDGNVSAVSSADVYEFDTSGQVVTITSYAVEVETDTD